MATFYLLPPRPLLAEKFADFLRTLLPGIDLEGTDPATLTDMLVDLAGKQTAIYLIYREELPEGDDTATALRDTFGAESGDEVVEIRAGTARRWRIAG